MSAPQIPNLNTLRSGRNGARGRLRGRGGHDSSSSGPGAGRKDKDRVVQGTDNDASVSRLSAVGLGYLDDPFARALTPQMLETRRLPIINRGWFACFCFFWRCGTNWCGCGGCRNLRTHHNNRPARRAIPKAYGGFRRHMEEQEEADYFAGGWV
ncbi:hypothetical protein BDV06DRAFT_93988 [Aspergillus oleicola]